MKTWSHHAQVRTGSFLGFTRRTFMHIDIRALHSDVTDGIKEYILERGQRIERYFGGVTRCEFVLGQDAKDHVVDIKVHGPRRSDLTASSSHEDLHAAIDLAMDKIERQVRRLKERFKEHHPRDRGGEREARSPVDTQEETYEDVVREEL
jgi:putative sigma-54 modulation protein